MFALGLNEFLYSARFQSRLCFDFHNFIITRKLIGCKNIRFKFFEFVLERGMLTRTRVHRNIRRCKGRRCKYCDAIVNVHA